MFPVTEQIPASTRIIAVELTEDEWRAFRAIEPQPLAWLQQKIRERVEELARGVQEQDEY